MYTLFEDNINADQIRETLTKNLEQRGALRNGLTPMQKLAKERKWSLIEVFLEFPADADAENKARYGDVLLRAAQDGEKAIAAKLIAAGANCNWSNSNTGRNLVHEIIEKGDLTLLNLILNSNANFKQRTKENVSPILLAAQQNKWDLVRALATKLGKENFNESFQYKQVLELAKDIPDVEEQLTKLTVPTWETTSADELKVLLEIPSFREQQNNGLTPIKKLANEKKWDLVRVFTEFPVDADAEIKANYGDALLSAAWAGETEIASKLIQAGASCNWSYSNTGRNLVHEIVEKGDLTLLNLILNSNVNFKANFKQRTKENVSPILLAAQQSKWDLVSVLATKLGIENFYESFQYKQVLELAKGITEVEEQLTKLIVPTWETTSADELRVLLKNPSFREQQNNGLTPIAKLANEKKWDLVRVFTEFPVSTDEEKKANYGDALLTAAQNGQMEIAKKLISAGASCSWQSETNRNLVHEIVEKGDDVLLKLVLNSNANPKQKTTDNIPPILLAANLKKWDRVGALAVKFQKMAVTVEEEALYKQIIGLAKAEPLPPMYEINILTEMADRRFIMQFQKVYTALYEAQSSVFKKGKQWTMPGFTRKDVEDYIKKNPDSRSAQALALTDTYLQSGEEKTLVKAIHKYGYHKSSSLGLFKTSKHKQGLEDNFEETYKGADKKSRTGKIRESLNPTKK